MSVAVISVKASIEFADKIFIFAVPRAGSGACLSLMSVTLVYCRQTLGWIKMKLGTEVGLDPGHTVLEGTQQPLPQRGTAPPSFWPMSVVTKRLHRSKCHFVRR